MTSVKPPCTMAPPAPAAKKGQGKSAKNNTDRRSLSRHSTPVSALTDASPSTPTTPSLPSAPRTTMAKETPYLRTSTAALISQELSIEAHIEKSISSSAKPGDPPSARELHKLNATIRDTVNRFMSKRGEVCDRSMRQLVQRRKERVQHEREQEAARAAAESARVKREQEAAKKGKGTPHKKRSHDEMNLDSDEKERKAKNEALPNVGAHGLARQDGVGVQQGAEAPPSPPVQPGTLVPDLMDTAGDSGDDSDATQRDPPQTAPLYERIYGKDPTAAEDPIIYDIQDINEATTHEEKARILQVKEWPTSDLHEWTAGDPPDKDFSNAKPANQVNFSTFQTYVEPYIRPFTEEDVAFLKERGDRHAPYVIPQRGAKDYKDVWSAEDGSSGLEPPKRHVNNPNEARGSMEDMEDDIADQDTISMGPVMSRLNSLIRPAPTAPRKDDSEDANGDTSMVNGEDDAGPALTNGNADEHKPVACLPDGVPKPPTQQLPDYDSLENRALAELRYLGMIGPNETTNFDAREDDEVSARLRTLQHELRRVSRLNNIKKARVLELTEERMAMQEYSNISDDLDNQVNAAYLKRNRSMAKPNQKKGGGSRPGQKGVASAPAGRGVSDGVRALMQKRYDWTNMVGPVVGYGRPPIPGKGESIFKEDDIKKFERQEREAELGDVEGE